MLFCQFWVSSFRYFPFFCSFVIRLWNSPPDSYVHKGYSEW